MYLFQFSLEEILTFFAVLVRYSVLFAVMPFIGDRFVLTPVKILLAVAVTLVAFPQLVSSGAVQVSDAQVWGSTVSGIASVVALETMFGLCLGFVARLAFDAITFGGNLAGQFMGFAAASAFDPHQETQTQVVAEVQSSLAMLLFLALNGHHILLKASLDSYGAVRLGSFQMSATFAEALTKMTGQVLLYGLQIAAPIAVSLFVVNIAFGVMSKAMPQLNILVLSFAVTALVGLLVMGLSMSEFGEGVTEIHARGFEWLEGAKRMLGKGA
jgi:flagellar biosynthetic protein FliR